MAAERRQHTRLAYPLEGSWHGASGATRCRISDISVTGCFIESLAAPAVGENTTITVDFGPDDTYAIKGRVAYLEPGMGFGVEFVEADPATTAALGQAISSIAGRSKA